MSLAALMAGAALAAPAAQAAPAVTWADEFNGTGLDLTRWTPHGVGLRGQGISTPLAVTVGGGALTIRTFSLLGLHFTGMIATRLVGPLGFEQTYGYFEARVKFNSSPGQWSAFWLQSPTNGSPVGDPATAGVEMDIAEHRARCVTAPAPTPPATCAPGNDISNRIQQALIWDGYGADTKSAVRLSDPLPGLGNGSWHIWTLRWTPTQLTFYYDGTPTWMMNAPISRRSQYLVLSTEVNQLFAGAIPAAGYGSATTNMQVDYVRVWSLG